MTQSSSAHHLPSGKASPATSSTVLAKYNLHPDLPSILPALNLPPPTSAYTQKSGELFTPLL